jgi:glycosyltransferase involved in cell wall biosynthesis
MSRPLDVACIVPVYNEAGVLEAAVRQLHQALADQLAGQEFKIIIAANGSTDNTNAIGRRLERGLGPVVELAVCRSKGRGMALRETISRFHSTHYLYIDVDLPCDLTDLPRVLAPLSEGADVVTSRRTGYRPALRRAMTWGLRHLNRLMFGVRISDSQCAIKALSPAGARVLLDDCQQNGWFLDTELVVLAARRGLRVSEVPIHWIERRFPDRASKVRPWRDTVAAMTALRQIRRRRDEIPPGRHLM